MGSSCSITADHHTVEHPLRQTPDGSYVDAWDAQCGALCGTALAALLTAAAVRELSTCMLPTTLGATEHVYKRGESLCFAEGFFVLKRGGIVLEYAHTAATDDGEMSAEKRASARTFGAASSSVIGTTGDATLVHTRRVPIGDWFGGDAVFGDDADGVRDCGARACSSGDDNAKTELLVCSRRKYDALSETTRTELAPLLRRDFATYLERVPMLAAFGNNARAVAVALSVRCRVHVAAQGGVLLDNDPGANSGAHSALRLRVWRMTMPKRLPDVCGDFGLVMRGNATLKTMFGNLTSMGALSSQPYETPSLWANDADSVLDAMIARTTSAPSAVALKADTHTPTPSATGSPARVSITMPAGSHTGTLSMLAGVSAAGSVEASSSASALLLAFSRSDLRDAINTVKSRTNPATVGNRAPIANALDSIVVATPQLCQLTSTRIQQRLAALGAPLVRDMSPAEVGTLVTMGMIRTEQRGATVLDAADEPRLVIVLNGKVRVHTATLPRAENGAISVLDVISGLRSVNDKHDSDSKDELIVGAGASLRFDSVMTTKQSSFADWVLIEGSGDTDDACATSESHDGLSTYLSDAQSTATMAVADVAEAHPAAASNALAVAHTRCVILSFTQQDVVRMWQHAPTVAAHLFMALNEQPLSNPPPLRAVLNHSASAYFFEAHVRAEFSAENYEFWRRVDAYERECGALLHSGGMSAETLLNTTQRLYDAACLIVAEFVVAQAPSQINIKNTTVTAIQAHLAGGPNSNMLQSVFYESKAEVFRLMKQDSYERFKKSDHFGSMLTCLSALRGKVRMSGEM